ncbi:hypothetical protein IQ07DRAFT_324839 [Pyrenochaeta sp. DS3sAY3a]|nr:hypothetical protein IQ07DRAFT_324839 [Pyrenochaeta sp. DS3sAY3a]
MAPIRRNRSTPSTPGGVVLDHFAYTGAAHVARRRNARGRKNEMTADRNSTDLQSNVASHDRASTPKSERGGRQGQDSSKDDLDDLHSEGSRDTLLPDSNGGSNSTTTHNSDALRQPSTSQPARARSSVIRTRRVAAIASKRSTTSGVSKPPTEKELLKRRFPGNKKLQAVLAGTWRRTTTNPSTQKRSAGNGDVLCDK